MTKKKINNLRILQIGLLILIFASFIPGIMNAGQMLFDEDESRVWGYAYHFLGVDWSAYMQQDSLISFGYSLLLAPICALLKRPGAIYKVAVFGNAVALCISYVISLYVSEKLFPDKNKTAITLACGLAALCPGTALIRLTAVPDMMLALLIWISLALLISIEENPSSAKMIGFGMTLGIGVMFHAAMLWIAAAGILVLFKMNKRKGITEKQMLQALLPAVLIAGGSQLIENFWINRILEGTEYHTGSGIYTMLLGMAHGWDIKGLEGFFQGMAGKLFSVGAGTALFALIGFWTGLFGKHHKSAVCSFVLTSFSFLLVSMSLYYETGVTGDSILNARLLFLISGPLIIIGFMELWRRESWTSLLFGGAGACILLTFCTAAALKTYAPGTMEFFNSGVLTDALVANSKKMQNSVYLIGIMTVVVPAVFIAVIRNSFKIGRRQQAASFAGAGLFLLCFLGIGFTMQRYDIFSLEKHVEDNTAQIVSILDQTPEELGIYYKAEGKEQDSKISKAQYLLGTRQLKVVNLEKDMEKSRKDLEVIQEFQERKENQESYCFLVSAQDTRLDRYADEFLLADLSDDYALFMQKDSEEAKLYQKLAGTHIYSLPLNPSDEDELQLAPGTYEWSVSLQKEDNSKKEMTEVSVLSGKTVLSKISLGEESFEAGEAKAGLTVTSMKRLRDVSVQVKGGKAKAFAYRKTSDQYTAGAENPQAFDKVCKVVQRIQQTGYQGKSLGYLGYGGSVKTNLERVKEQLEGCSVKNVVTGDESDCSFLIAQTESRDYYDYLESYQILAENEGYVLLGKIDEELQTVLTDLGMEPLSEGKLLKAEGSLLKGDSPEAPLKIMSGSFEYVFQIKKSDKKLSGNATLILESGNGILAEKKIAEEDFDKEGIAEVKIPLALKEAAKKVSYRIEGNDYEQVKPIGLTMLSNKFEIGSDNPEGMKTLTGLIRQSGEYAPVYYVTSVNAKSKNMFSLANLRQELEDYEVAAATQSEVKYLKSDCFIILDRFTSSTLGLTNYFTLVAQEGNYSLWVSNYGRLAGKICEKRMPVLSSGNKVSALAFYEANENADETFNRLGAFGAGSYEISLTLESERIEGTTLAAVQIIGITKADEKTVLEDVIVDSMVTLDQFEDGNHAAMTLKLELKDEVDQLEVRTVNFGGNIINAEPEWVEKK